MTLTDEQLREMADEPLNFDETRAIAAKLLAARARLREMEGALREAEDALKYAAGCDINEHCGYLIETALIRAAKALEMSAETKPDYAAARAQPAESGAKEDARSFGAKSRAELPPGRHYDDLAPPTLREPGDDEALLRQAYARSLACDEINDELWNGVIKRGAIQELSIRHLLSALATARASGEAKGEAKL